MYELSRLFAGLASGVRAGVGLVLPIFADPTDFRAWPPWLRWAVQLALVLVVCLGLVVLQRNANLDFFLKYSPQGFRQFFLPALFLLLVAFSWLAYGLWRQYRVEPEADEFPDILWAWTDAVRRLEEAGLGLADAPLFLVLGRPATDLDALFEATGDRDIIRAPDEWDAPVRVYATDDAVFVTCPGASGWGEFCTRAVSDPGGPEDLDDPTGRKFGLRTADGTAKPEDLEGALLEEFLALNKLKRTRPLTPVEERQLQVLGQRVTAAGGLAVDARPRKLEFADVERIRMVRRFRYLCKLIRRSRAPWCPVNGVLVLVPWAATDTPATTDVGSDVLYAELTAAREEFRLRYPTFALVTDLEELPGFAEFRYGFVRPEMLNQRLGQRTPLAWAGKKVDAAALVASAAEWVGAQLLPQWIYRFLRSDVTSGPAVVEFNRNLFRLMREVGERGPRLGELLARGVPPAGGGDEYGDSPMFGGLYLGATGRDADRRAFVAGVVDRLVERQNAVSWAPDAVAEDARIGRLATAVGAVVSAVGVVLALYFLVRWVRW